MTHYATWRRNGDPLPLPRKSIHERFKEKYIVDPVTACWLWTAYVMPNGYARFGIEGGWELAHRVSFRLHKGPIPEGYTIDHTCHNGTGCTEVSKCLHRRCVNPEHLEAVTRKVNNLRGEGLAAIETRKTHCPKGHKYDYFWRNNRACRTCRQQRNDARV